MHVSCKKNHHNTVQCSLGMRSIKWLSLEGFSFIPYLILSVSMCSFYRFTPPCVDNVDNDHVFSRQNTSTHPSSGTPSKVSSVTVSLSHRKCRLIVANYPTNIIFIYAYTHAHHYRFGKPGPNKNANNVNIFTSIHLTRTAN